LLREEFHLPPVTYVHDIAPMFRQQDVTCMSQQNVFLNSADWMGDPAGNDAYADHANARRVFEALSNQSMPPDAPWSQSWLDTYQAWMNGGFAR
jgi:hypothetical protein